MALIVGPQLPNVCFTISLFGWRRLRMSLWQYRLGAIDRKYRFNSFQINASIDY